MDTSAHTTGSAPSRTRPRLYRAAGAARIAVGLFFLVPGVTKFADHTTQVALFTGWGVPAPEVAVLVVGAGEVVAGAALALGLAMPLPAFFLAGDMVGALLTAGVVDGGARIAAPLVVLAALGFVLSRWGGAWQRGRGLRAARAPR